ncbi:hypothetical protein [Actinoplanes sp. NPDC020271]|uniref:hypothetical protein n=1 Tax=Actinoplanes sp. NPDC020271 TaxID=3363896 RepID=UPI0037B6D99C
MTELLRGLVADLDGASRADLRRAVEAVFFPNDVVDDDSVDQMQVLAEWGVSGDVATQSTSLRILSELLRAVATGRVVVSHIDALDLRTRQIRSLLVHRVADSVNGEGGSEILALFWLDLVQDGDWLDALAPVSRSRENDPGLQRRLGELLSQHTFSSVQVGAAVAVARMSTGHRLPDSVSRVFQMLLDSPTFPGDELSEDLGDARSTIRRVTDGFAEQIPMFVRASRAGHPLTRYQNIGECVRIMETWRDAPGQMVVQLAEHLHDSTAPVRAAAVGAIYRSGQAGLRVLDDIAALLAAPAAGLSGAAPAPLMDMLRATALGSLVAGNRDEAVPELNAYLAAPYGSISLSEVIAEASYAATDIAEQVKLGLRAALDPGADTDTLRRVASLLSGVKAWGAAAAPLIPELGMLLAAGVAESAVVEVAAAIGPVDSQAVDVLLGQIRGHEIPPVRRITAAAGLIRGEENLDEAIAVLLSMLGDRDVAPLVLKFLANLGWPEELRNHARRIAMVAASMLGSAVPFKQMYVARVLWQCGDYRDECAAIISSGIAPCAEGILCIDWLADMGQLATPHRGILAASASADKRVHCRHVDDRLVLADERYLAALFRALTVIPG